jgi:hypothetical protein
MRLTLTPVFFIAALAGCAATPAPKPRAAPAPVVSLDPAEEPAATESTASPDGQADEELSDREIAERAEALDALETHPTHDALTDGADEPNILGGATGTSLGGLGLAGRGGGGHGSGIGLGTVGAIGHGSSGFGGGQGRSGRSYPLVKPGSSSTNGALDKDIIRRTIRLRMSEFRSCYEKQLQREPDLNGKVVAKFTIGRSGHVVHTTIATGMQPDVDACIKRVFTRMVFPKPTNDGVVTVSYPLVFSPGKKAAPKSSP